jgi:hypothetical protein
MINMEGMMTATECLQHAMKAGIAARAEDGQRRNALFAIARAWESLAKVTKRYEHLETQSSLS